MNECNSIFAILYYKYEIIAEKKRKKIKIGEKKFYYNLVYLYTYIIHISVIFLFFKNLYSLLDAIVVVCFFLPFVTQCIYCLVIKNVHKCQVLSICGADERGWWISYSEKDISLSQRLTSFTEYYYAPKYLFRSSRMLENLRFHYRSSCFRSHFLFVTFFFFLILKFCRTIFMYDGVRTRNWIKEDKKLKTFCEFHLNTAFNQCKLISIEKRS